MKNYLGRRSHRRSILRRMRRAWLDFRGLRARVRRVLRAGSYKMSGGP